MCTPLANRQDWQYRSWLAFSHFSVFEAVAGATRYENHVLKFSDFALIRYDSPMQRQLKEGKFVDI